MLWPFFKHSKSYINYVESLTYSGTIPSQFTVLGISLPSCAAFSIKCVKQTVTRALRLCCTRRTPFGEGSILNYKFIFCVSFFTWQDFGRSEEMALNSWKAWSDIEYLSLTYNEEWILSTGSLTLFSLSENLPVEMSSTSLFPVPTFFSSTEHAVYPVSSQNVKAFPILPARFFLVSFHYLLQSFHSFRLEWTFLLDSVMTLDKCLFVSFKVITSFSSLDHYSTSWGITVSSFCCFKVSWLICSSNLHFLVLNKLFSSTLRTLNYLNRTSPLIQ